jgi:hypothetical protein
MTGGSNATRCQRCDGSSNDLEKHFLKERTMGQAKHKADFGAWLRRTWNALMCALEGIDRSPMEDVVDRLERERDAPVVLRRSQGRMHKV